MEYNEIKPLARDLFRGLWESGQHVSLKAIAKQFNVPLHLLRTWVVEERWSDGLPKRRGAPPGNVNSKGHKNALGNNAGPPIGNCNHVKDGFYITNLTSLSEKEREFLSTVPLTGKAALEDEMRILKIRELRIVTKLNFYEDLEAQGIRDSVENGGAVESPETAVYVTTSMETTSDKGCSVMTSRDSLFSRIQKLYTLLHKVQSSILKVASAIQSIEENEKRISLEEERVKTMKARVFGSVEVEDDFDDVEGDFKSDERGGELI